MITMQLTIDVKDDRQVVLTLPPDVPVGQRNCLFPSPSRRRQRSRARVWRSGPTGTRRIGANAFNPPTSKASPAGAFDGGPTNRFSGHELHH